MIVLGTQYLNGCNIQVGYDLLNQDIPNNRSYIKAYIVLNVTNVYISWTRGKASVWNNSTGIGTRYNKGSYTLCSSEGWIYHDNSGNYSGYIGGSLNTTFVSGSTGGNFTLPTIPRQANVTRFDNFNDEENPIIYFNNPGGFKINARLEFAGVNINRKNIPNTGIYKFELTEEERNLIRNKTPNSNTMGIRGTIGTCIGQETENFWSFLDRTVTIVNANPIFNNFVYEDNEEKSLMLTNNSQLLIKNISHIVLTPNLIKTKKGATPKHYVITFDNKIITVNHDSNLLHINIDNINFSGSKRLSVRAYDSRNNSTEVFKDVMILDYSEPKIYATLERKNQFEKETTLKINGKYDELKINDEAKNQLVKLKYRYRETGGILGEWVNVSVQQENGSYSCNDIILNLDNSKSYEFELYAEDKLKSNIFNIGVGVGIPAFFISSNKKAIGVNCIPPEDASEGEIYFRSNDGIVKQVLDYNQFSAEKGTIQLVSGEKNFYPCPYRPGDIYITMNNDNPEFIWGGKWEKIEGKFLIASGNGFALGQTGGKYTHTHTLNNAQADIGYNWQDNQNRIMQRNSGRGFNANSRTNGNNNSFSYGFWWASVGAALSGTTDAEDHMPPYLSVNIWKRIS